MTFGEKVKELRSKKGISQTEFGKAVGVSLRTVRGWEVVCPNPNQRDH